MHSTTHFLERSQTNASYILLISGLMDTRDAKPNRAAGQMDSRVMTTSSLWEIKRLKFHVQQDCQKLSVLHITPQPESSSDYCLWSSCSEKVIYFFNNAARYSTSEPTYRKWIITWVVLAFLLVSYPLDLNSGHTFYSIAHLSISKCFIDVHYK